jgi:hypothetical protein
MAKRNGELSVVHVQTDKWRDENPLPESYPHGSSFSEKSSSISEKSRGEVLRLAALKTAWLTTGIGSSFAKARGTIHRTIALSTISLCVLAAGSQKAAAQAVNALTGPNRF